MRRFGKRRMTSGAGPPDLPLRTQRISCIASSIPAATLRRNSSLAAAPSPYQSTSHLQEQFNVVVYHPLGVLAPFFVAGLVTMWLRTCTLADQVQTLTHRSELVEKDCQHRVQAVDTEMDSVRGDVRSVTTELVTLKALDDQVRALRERVQDVEKGAERGR